MATLSRNILEIRYAIRDLVPLAKKLEREGKRIIYLNIGDPLKYDFETPRHIIEAMYKASLEGHNYYSDSLGIEELREAISDKLRELYGIDVPPSRVVVTSGVAEAINFTFRALLDPGDEVLVPGPAYPAYISAPMIYHGKAVEYRCPPEYGYAPDPDDIRRKITGRTKAILINTPNNPTGSVYPAKTLREVLDIAAEHGIPVISDEIYDRIILEGEYHHPYRYVGEDVLYIGLNGFSKQYLMTGWRLGYLYVSGPEGDVDAFMEAIAKQARNRLCPSTPAQYGGVAALRGGDEHLHDMIMRLRRRMETFVKMVGEVPGIEAEMPRATFYVFPRIDTSLLGDDKSFVERLLVEEGVYLVHGSGFGRYGEGHFRAVVLAPEELLVEAVDRISRFVRRRLS